VSAPGFDELIHQSTRLSIVALLAAADWMDFAFIREELGLSESALSKQLSTLEEAGYVTIERPLSNHRRRVRVRLTPEGRTAFQAHVAALRTIVAGAGEAASA
jgi:DNA-binding MarR family transcriptional regulator